MIMTVWGRSIGHPANKPRTVADAEPLLYQGIARVGGTPEKKEGFGTALGSLAIPAGGNPAHTGGGDLVVSAPLDISVRPRPDR